jgi:galactose mutarotase-like enzyme
MILLENEYVKASFEPRGAELKSLFNKKTNLEHLWSGDPAFWGKSSPVLFPIVGALKDNAYFYKNKRYEMSRHGFARDKVFKTEQISGQEVLFTLESDEETLLNYPFQFKLCLRYRLEKASLSCSYEVFNPGTETLLFSVGGHPAFAVPLQKGEAYQDYFLGFNKDQYLLYHKIEQNLIDEETEELPLNDGKLELQHSLFYDDALVFKSLKSDRISIGNKNNGHGLQFSFEGFPFFGIWAAKDADFVCLEPWCGIADSIHHDQQLEDKEGILSLGVGEQWKRTWRADVF